MPDWPRLRRFSVRFIMVVFALVAVLLAGTWSYVAYRVHRAKSMLAEAARVRIGDSEPSVLPFVQRYGGSRYWTDTRADVAPRENWTDQWAYEHALRTATDYGYGVEVNRWRFPKYAVFRNGQAGGFDNTARTATEKLPAQLRAVFGLRDWDAVVGISIREGRVSRVDETVIVEGRPGWLAYSSIFVQEMPYEEWQSRAYAVDGGALTLEGYGEVAETFVTPKASPQEFERARKVNTGCLTSMKGCENFCDLVPRTIQHVYRHPDSAPHLTVPACQ